ncbi:acyl-CoA dehydrogenase FadE18 [Mycobacterium bohemicum DSM 44277]|uniref:Acyl-CoA dehydrogenase FadE18 n=1 Tax=Mycobacterium bohemicum DSM 44277 TaxID=1236609 RepID=A0A0U0WBR2_MYCBE|nr:acyl-CoA dehydrogenase family protein [Mycobacterium bohemicum]CPR12486.1 acyl-CoA dehydrogenase FadE18 [Mycobacterium bohemicum DSM 44277]
MSAGDLLYSDTEEALRDGVRQLFADRCPPEQVARAYDPQPQDFSAVWQTLAAELGVAGLLVPEALGGAGATAREADDASVAAATAQAYCSGVAVHAAEECVQLHGGIGMTWEYPAHLYLKRAKSDQLALGTAYRHRARLAELVGLPAG